MEKVISRCESETREAAKKFAETLVPGSIVALTGELGAGKTAFTRGIADFFQIEGEVSSPTFTIVNEYNGTLNVYHFDAYRLENVSEEDCDWLDDYFFGDGICVIEWAQNIKRVLPKGYIQVRIEKNPQMGEDYREIFFEKTER